MADIAAPGSVVFAEGELQPQGELKSNADSVAETLTGEASLSDFVISELESSAGDEGKSLDFDSEVQPWLGGRGAVAFEKVVDGELSEPLIAVQTTDADAAQAFVEKKAGEGDDPSKEESYEGVDFEVGGAEGNAVGLIDDTLVLAASEKEFEAAVDASQGDSLGGEDRFQQAIAAASSGSLADVYIDFGSISKQSGDKVDPRVRTVLQAAGVDLSEATAVASVIPHSDQIEVDVSSALGGKKAPSGDASKLLGSLPASSLAAFSFANFGAQLEEAFDKLDEEGVPPDLKPGELKGTLAQAGIDLDKIAASLEEGAVFVEGKDRDSLAGAMVITAKSSEAAQTIGKLGFFLRAAHVPGVTLVGSEDNGFSVSNSELGGKPFVAIGKGDRIALGYGLAQAVAALNAGSGDTLAGNADYKAAAGALGKTPISGFVDGPAALQLAESLIPHSKKDFWEAVPYLEKVGYVGIGSGSDGEFATARIIAGIGG